MRPIHPEFTTSHNQFRSSLISLKWNHNKVCFEDLSFTYNLTALAPKPECSKTVITTETEAVINELCSGTKYEVFLYGHGEFGGVDHDSQIVRECFYTLG